MGYSIIPLREWEKENGYKILALANVGNVSEMVDIKNTAAPSLPYHYRLLNVRRGWLANVVDSRNLRNNVLECLNVD